MNNPRVKVVPHKEVKDVFVPEYISLEHNNLKLSFTDNRFCLGDSFDVILEVSNQLKFLKTSLVSHSDTEAQFEVYSSRDITKREYERISITLDVLDGDVIAQTINISAGGMQIRSEKELLEDSTYDLVINYDSKELPVKYQVLRVKAHKNRFLVSGKFVEMDKDSKAFIMQQNLKSKIFSLKSLPIRQEGGENA